MKKILLIFTLFILTGCGVSLKTTKFQPYKWNMVEQDYRSDNIVYFKDMKFKFTDTKVKFKFDKEKHIVKLISDTTVMDSSVNEQSIIMDGYLDDEIPCRIVYYPRTKTVLIYENMDEKRFNSFVIFQ